MSNSSVLPARAAPSFAPSPPTLQGWRLVRFLGAGNFTRVFQARPAGSSESDPADYAVKIPNLNHPQNHLAAELLAREATVAQHVSHANLVSVLEAKRAPDGIYLAMPYLPGVTLRQVLAARRRMALPKSLWVARQAANALAALHEQGWIHADVKPDHLMIAASGHVTLFDLGLAQRCARGPRATEAPMVGTPEYMAPEIFAASNVRDGRVDIYSLGITLYETLAGQLPHVATKANDLALMHLRREPPDVRIFSPSVPARLARLVRRMLAKEPMRRPDAIEVAEILAAIEIDVFDWR